MNKDNSNKNIKKKLYKVNFEIQEKISRGRKERGYILLLLKRINNFTSKNGAGADDDIEQPTL